MMKAFSLNGHAALVTGSSQGIGLAIALGLHEAGARVVAHGRQARPSDLPEDVSKPTQHVLSCIRRGEIYSEFPARGKVLAFWEQFGNNWADFSDF